MPPQLLVTVDTELSNFPGGQGLWGRVGSESWGLERLIQVFFELDVKATFFLDVYGGSQADLTEQQKAAELIAASDHDLQLHTHPAPSFDPARPQLCDYTFQEQLDIFDTGAGRIEQWTGKRPRLHRAGDWAANDLSLAALARSGFHADFSASAWSRSCRINSPAVGGNGWSRINGLLCGIGTCYIDRMTGRTRRLDLGGVSTPEVNDILSRGIDPLIITLHSFSLLHYNRPRTRFAGNPGYMKRLRDFLEHARQTYGYSVATASDAASRQAHLTGSTSNWAPMPTTKVAASCAGLIKSAYNLVSH